MLTRVKIENFKCIQSVDVPLSPLTAFVGPNDSGKTTILKAVQIGVTGEMELSRELAIAFSELALSPSSADSSSTTITLWQDPPESDSVSESNWERRIKTKVEKTIDNQDILRLDVKGDGPLLSALFYNPRPDLLKQPSYLPRTHYALPSRLARLIGEDRETFFDIENRLRKWVPTLNSIILKRSPDGVKDLLWFELTSGERVPSIMISDGSLLLLEYLTLLLTPPRLGILLIDGPEEGIHPRALEKLIAFFRSMQSENPELQILMSSHSPDLLSFLRPEEIVVTNREQGGYTQAARLDQHPDLNEWLEGLTPGELWLWDGEADILQRIRTAQEK